MLRNFIICTALTLSPLSALAQDEQNDLSQGAQLLSEGSRLILRGLLDELEPAAEGWAKLMEMLNDFSAYEMPEMLPNGDIIIRRKEPFEVLPDEDAEVEL